MAMQTQLWDEVPECSTNREEEHLIQLKSERTKYTIEEKQN